MSYLRYSDMVNVRRSSVYFGLQRSKKDLDSLQKILSVIISR